MGDRNKFINYVVKQFTAMGNHGDSAKLAKQWLEGLTDAEFDAFVEGIENGTDHLTYVVPNNPDVKYSLTDWLKLGDELGTPHFSKVLEEHPDSKLTALSNEEHWIAYMPQRSQIQHVDDKKSVAEDNNTRDLFTGQVTGSSKGSAVSAPQFGSILSRGCMATALEFAKFRGGDIDAGREFNARLIEGGQVYIEPMVNTGSKPTVTFSVAAFLNGMHLANNLVKPKA